MLAGHWENRGRVFHLPGSFTVSCGALTVIGVSALPVRETAVKVVCAWCKKEMGEKPLLEDLTTTHSICESCLAKTLKSAFPPVSPPPEVKERCLNLLLTELA